VVVLGGVGEAVQRRGRGVVELAERARAERAVEVHLAIQQRALRFELALETAHEEARVEAAHDAALEVVRAGGEVVGDGDGDGGLEPPPRRIALLAQQLEQYVAAEREADGAAPHVGEARGEVVEHEADVAGLARVVEARGAVRLAAARAEVEPDALDARGGELRVGGERVAAAGRALEAVQQQHLGRAVARCGREVEVEEVAVRRLDALAPQREGAAEAEQPPADGLPVAPGQPPGGAEGAGGVVRERRRGRRGDRIAHGAHSCSGISSGGGPMWIRRVAAALWPVALSVIWMRIAYSPGSTGGSSTRR